MKRDDLSGLLTVLPVGVRELVAALRKVIRRTIPQANRQRFPGPGTASDLKAGTPMANNLMDFSTRTLG
jgi:hypothetical protein